MFFTLSININENYCFSNLKRINKEMIKMIIINFVF